METTKKSAITIKATIDAPIEKVWDYWTNPEHIMQWCSASDDWHAPYADNDVRTGGKFKTTMAAKDKSMQFDFEGVYSNVEPLKRLQYTMPDGRTVDIIFSKEGNQTQVIETFDPEDTHPEEMQRGGWQAILDNFKKHVEQS